MKPQEGRLQNTYRHYMTAWTGCCVTIILRNEKYTIQRHDTRKLLTINGPVRFNHTLFPNREDGSHHYLLDEWLGLDAHERLSRAAETAVLVEAAKSSYGRAAKILGKDAEISKTAVMEKVHAMQAEIPFEKPEKKKCANISISKQMKSISIAGEDKA